MSEPESSPEPRCLDSPVEAAGAAERPAESPAEPPTGHPALSEDLIAQLYPDLKRIAAGHLRREHHQSSLGTTGLVHEAWIELARQRKALWQGSRHLLSLASSFMRRILLLRARHRNAIKRGSGLVLDSLDRDTELRLATQVPSSAVAIVPMLVSELERLDPFKAKIVRLRVWHGLTVPECAEYLGVSTATVDRHWSLACSWLHDALSP